MEKDTIEITPDYTYLLRVFSADAIRYLELFAKIDGAIRYEHLYSFVASLGIALACVDPQDRDSLRAFAEFRNEFHALSAKMLERLNHLYEKEENPV